MVQLREPRRASHAGRNASLIRADTVDGPPTSGGRPLVRSLPLTVRRHELANGLTLVVRRDASAPVVAIVTFVSAGYFDETDDVVGIAHVLEHMFFKGTPTRGVGEIAKETKASGTMSNACGGNLMRWPSSFWCRPAPRQ